MPWPAAAAPSSSWPASPRPAARWSHSSPARPIAGSASSSWSALAGLAWAAYSVALGYFGGQWLGATWLATGVSLVALFGAGAAAAYLMRRQPRTTEAS